MINFRPPTYRVWLLLCLNLSILSLVSGQAPSPVLVDLEKDGRNETVFLTKFAEDENEGDYYQLQVADDERRIIWSGPKVKQDNHPFVFGNWHFGSCLPELIADIDGDGFLELVASEPQSDLSPNYFRVLRWSNGRFTKIRSASLVESPGRKDFFPWEESTITYGTWVTGFKQARADGGLVVGIVSYLNDTVIKSGQALIDPVQSGFQLRKWIVPLTDPAMQGPEFSYVARLSQKDHQNSAGVALTNVAAILRQDRANYHKGKGDSEDTGKEYFATLSSRNQMETLQVRPIGSSSESFGKMILQGTPLVGVSVTESDLLVKIIAE